MENYAFKCNEQGQCPSMHICDPLTNLCMHTLLHPTFWSIAGSFIIAFIAGISTVAGLGGGGPMLSFLIVCFNYSPKISTLLVYCLILGATTGNVLNQATTEVNGVPMIKFRYCFVSIPFMFAGSLVGVMVNKFFPSIVVCLIIIVTSASSLRSIYNRYKVSYQQQTEENLKAQQNSKQIEMIAGGTSAAALEQKPINVITRVNPFDSPQHRLIFKKLAVLVLVFLVLQMIRGSQRFHSIVGVQSCSPTYWFVELLIFAVVLVFGWHHVNTVKDWENKEDMLLSNNSKNRMPIETQIREIIKGSVLGGLYSGFGLGGGLFLVPTYKSLGLNPLQSTAATSFNILITATINTIQSIFIGVIHLEELIYFLVLTCCGSFFVSRIISNKLQKINRQSIVELMLVILLGLSIFNIPYGLVQKYIESGYDNQILFGFGRLC